MSSVYESGSYWENVPSMHEKEASLKASRAYDLCKSLGVSSIMDIGCGSGRALSILCGLTGASGLGLDLSPQAVEWATERYSNERIRYRKASFRDVDEVVDLVMLFDVFEHVDDYIGFLRDIRVKARYVVFSIPLDLSVWSILSRGYMKARRKIGHLHYFTRESALATLEYAGYKIVSWKYTDPGLHGWKEHRRIGSLLAFAPRALLALLSKNFSARVFGGNSIFVLAETGEASAPAA